MTGGIYGLQFRSNGPCTPPNTITAQYFVYYDNNLVKNGSFTLGGCFNAGSYPYYNTTFETPLKTNYSFNISPTSLCLGKGTTPSFTLGNGCTNIEIDTTTEMVNLQILSGSEFTSFYGYQEMITDNLTVPYSALNSIELKQDQFFSGSQTTVLVQTSLSGLTKMDSITAYPKSSYGINPSTVPYPIQYGDTKYIEVTTYGPGGCSAIFPSDIKLNAVITEGNESGYLQDFDHGTTGDTLTNITFNSFGGNHIGFISDGVKKDIADTVIVTFSTTDAEIGTKQVAIIINPGPLYLAIEPENVAPGDTALIIIKSRLEDGTLIDFPEWQTFEVKMIEGCALGKILAGEDTARYFYDVPQPIKFIADSLAGGTVGLIVGLVEEIIGTRPVQENDADKIEEVAKEKQNKLIAEKTKKEINENPPLNPGAEMCPAEEMQSFLKEKLHFSMGDGCDALNSCLGVPYPEFVQYKIVPSGISHGNPNICTPNVVDPITGLLKIQVGGFSALEWRFERTQKIDAEPCFDSENSTVHFNMVLSDVETNQNSLILKPEAIFEICENNITNAGLILISSTEQVLNIIRQFPDQIPIIKNDMDSSLSRYGAQIVKYKFRQEIIAHETEHKKDYEYYLDSLKVDWLDARVIDYTYTCSQFKANPYATEEAKVEHLSIVREYVEMSNREAFGRTDEIILHQRLTIQTSLFEYYNLLYKFENGIIF